VPAVPQVIMYTTATCPYCIQAERLLTRKGVAHIDKVRVDLDPTLRMEMMRKTVRRTVPQIYVGEQYVGGFEELAQLDHAGKLDALLAGSSEENRAVEG
jgi:glutaredoxin 3